MQAMAPRLNEKLLCIQKPALNKIERISAKLNRHIEMNFTKVHFIHRQTHKKDVK